MSSPRRVQRRWLPVAAAAIALAFALAHGSRVRANLRVVDWEDRAFFTYVAKEIHSLSDCFLKPGFWPGLYRPVSTNLYYWIVGALGGGGVVLPHVASAVLIVANGALLGWVCLDFMGLPFAIAAGVIAVSRLALAEVALHTCEMQALSYVFFGLLACKAWLAAERRAGVGMAIASGALLFVACFAKETAASFLLVLAAWSRLGASGPDGSGVRARRGLLAVPAAFVLAAGAILLLFGWPLAGGETEFRYDWSAGNLLGNLTALLLSFSNSLVDLRAPQAMPPLVIRLAALWSVRALVLGLVGAELAVLVRPALAARATVRLLALGFALFLAGVLPFLGFEQRLYMRYAYLGHAGLAICGAALLRALFLTAAAFSGRTPALRPRAPR